LQQERSSDIRSFQSLQSEEMVLKHANSHLDKSIAELSAIIANKDRQLIELNLQLQNRILKVVELEESIDEMKDQ
jgi:predicted  nucleic acid-binding Zn-ribbon protein